MASNDQKSSHFLIGVTLGTILGLLVAPRPGKETRKKLKEEAEKYLDIGKEAYEDVREKYEEDVEPVVSKIVEEVAPLVEVVKELSEPYKEDLLKKVQDFIEDDIKVELKKKRKFFSGMKKAS